MAAKTKPVVEPPKTKKFFKFINSNLQSLSARGNPLVYTPGTILEVPDADPDQKIQCSSGIHCIYLEGSDPIETSAIVFGPKVAVLEALEDDIIYFAKNGKCRLKKCVVLDVGDGDNIPLTYQQGNQNTHFAQRYVKNVTKITADNSWLPLLAGGYGADSLSNYAIKSGNYNADVEAELIKTVEENSYWIISVINTALATGKVFDTTNIKKMVGKSSSHHIIKWIEKFGDDEELAQNIDGSYIVHYAKVVGHKDVLVTKLIQERYTADLIAYSSEIYDDPRIEEFILSDNMGVYVEDIVNYAVAHQRNTPEIRKAILKLANSSRINYAHYYYFNDPYLNYVVKFGNAEGVYEIAKLSPGAALKYATQFGTNDELKNVVARDPKLAYEYVTQIGLDPIFYDSIAQSLSTVIAVIEKYGYVDELIQKSPYVHTRYNVSSTVFNQIINISRKYGINENFEKLVFNNFSDIWDYCYYAHILNRSLEVVQWFKDNVNKIDLYRIERLLSSFGSNSLLETLYCMAVKNRFADEADKMIANMMQKKCTKYFKVVYNLANGTKVSACVDKKTKHRKIYINAGEHKLVDSGMVYTNIFDAYEFADLHGRVRYGTKENLLIFECSGDSFIPARWTVDYNTVLAKGIDINAVMAAMNPQEALVACKMESTDIDKLRLELPSAGWLKNIKLKSQVSMPYYY